MSVAVGDEHVVVRPGHPGAHVLDGPAALVLALLEQESTPEQVAADVATLTGAPAQELARDVPTVVARLATAGLIAGEAVEAGTPNSAPGRHDPRSWPLPDTGCQATFDSWVGWSRTVPVAAGEHIVGLRADDPVLAERLAGLAGASEVDARGHVPARLFRGGHGEPVPGAAGVSPAGPAHWGCETVATGPDADALVGELAGWVTAVADVGVAGVVGVVGTAVETPAGLVVLPAGWSGVTSRRGLAAIGDPLPGPAVVLDLGAATARVAGRGVPVHRWLTTAPMSDAMAVADAYSRLVPPPPGATGGDVLLGLARLVTGCTRAVADVSAHDLAVTVGVEPSSSGMRRARTGSAP